MNIEKWLQELKVPREAYRVVSLLPLVYVAWADGKVQKAERDVILRIAREQGLLDHGGDAALERWLTVSDMLVRNEKSPPAASRAPNSGV